MQFGKMMRLALILLVIPVVVSCNQTKKKSAEANIVNHQNSNTLKRDFTGSPEELLLLNTYLSAGLSIQQIAQQFPDLIFIGNSSTLDSLIMYSHYFRRTTIWGYSVRQFFDFQNNQLYSHFIEFTGENNNSASSIYKKVKSFYFEKYGPKKEQRVFDAPGPSIVFNWIESDSLYYNVVYTPTMNTVQCSIGWVAKTTGGR